MWTVEFHPKAQEEFDALADSFIQKFNILLGKIKDDGFSNLPRNRVKYIGDGIRELRVTGKDGIARSLYVTETDEVLKILVVFVKKTEKTPMDKIELAQKRRGEPK